MTNEQGNDANEFDRLFALETGQIPPQQSAPANPGEAAGSAAPPSGEAAEAQGGQPAPEAGGEEAGATPATEPGATDPSDDDAWIAALPEDAQTRIREWRSQQDAALTDAENRFKALQGKVAPVQRRLSELERERALRTSPAPAPSAAPVQQPHQTQDSFFDSDEWQRYAEDFPSDAKVLRASLEAQERASRAQQSQLERRLADLEQRLVQTAQAVQSREAESEIDRLQSVHPDWQDINSSQEFASWFDNWRATQPKSLRGQYYDQQRLGELFNDSEFCIALIDSYKADHAAAQPPAPAATQPPATNSTPPAPPRQNVRVSMGVAPEVRGSAPVPQTVKLDDLPPGQQFDYLWANT